MAQIFIYSINNKKFSTDLGPEGMQRILKLYKNEVDSDEFNLLSFMGWFSTEFGRIDLIKEIVLFES